MLYSECLSLQIFLMCVTLLHNWRHCVIDDRWQINNELIHTTPLESFIQRHSLYTPMHIYLREKTLRESFDSFHSNALEVFELFQYCRNHISLYSEFVFFYRLLKLHIEDNIFTPTLIVFILLHLDLTAEGPYKCKFTQVSSTFPHWSLCMSLSYIGFQVIDSSSCSWMEVSQRKGSLRH